jgi:reactive intermediate/imine deaminase
VAHRQITTDQAPPPGGPYSQGIVAGDLVFLAGQVPMDTEGAVVEGGFDEQARRAFDNLAAVAAAADASLRDAVRVGVYLRDMGNFARMNEVFGEYFGDPPPVRTTIPAALTAFEIEVDAIIVRAG